jgi:hypothetical protein
MDLISLLLPLFSGAAGGNLVGGILKNFNLGSLGNSLAGLIGGGVGSLVLGNLLGMPMPVTGGVDPDGAALLGQILGGGAGGGVMTIIVGMLQKMLARPAA